MLQEKYKKEIVLLMKEKFGYKNNLAVPKIKKVVVNIVLPRIRDFRGLSPDSIDKSGNLNIGIREYIIFPELSGEDIKKIFGLEVTVVTDAKKREEATELF